MRGVKTKIANHDKMRFLNMLRETQEEVCCRKGFRKATGGITRDTDMCIVMEGYILAVTGIDSGSTHTGAPRITLDIFHEFL